MTYVKIDAQSVPKLEQHIYHLMEIDEDDIMYEPLIADGYIELNMPEWMEFVEDFKSAENPDQDFLSDWLIHKWNTEWNPKFSTI
jgi:hypothetical protein